MSRVADCDGDCSKSGDSFSKCYEHVLEECTCYLESGNFRKLPIAEISKLEESEIDYCNCGEILNSVCICSNGFSVDYDGKNCLNNVFCGPERSCGENSRCINGKYSRLRLQTVGELDCYESDRIFF